MTTGTHITDREFHEAKSAALAAITAERQRQVTQEGWSADHDDHYLAHELLLAAACYLTAAVRSIESGERLPAEPPDTWPWVQWWWKRSTADRCLEKAGALVLAEIARDLRRRGSLAAHDPGLAEALSHVAEQRCADALLDRRLSTPLTPASLQSAATKGRFAARLLTERPTAIAPQHEENAAELRMAHCTSAVEDIAFVLACVRLHNASGRSP